MSDDERIPDDVPYNVFLDVHAGSVLPYYVDIPPHGGKFPDGTKQ